MKEWEFEHICIFPFMTLAFSKRISVADGNFYVKRFVHVNNIPYPVGIRRAYGPINSPNPPLFCKFLLSK